MHRKIFTVGDSHSLRCFEQHAHIADSTALFGYNKKLSLRSPRLCGESSILYELVIVAG